MMAIGVIVVGAPGTASAVPTPVSLQCTPAPSDCNAWYRSPVTVKWDLPLATDVLAGTCVLKTLHADTSGTKVTCTAWEGGLDTGATTVQALIRIDATPPVVTAASDRPPDSDVWFNHPVGIAFAGSDPTSGIAACDHGVYGGPDGVGIRVAGSCRDVAGNVGTGALTLNYDSTPPAEPRATALPGDRTVALDWSVPPDATTVEVVRLPTAAAATVVFRGRDDRFTDRRLRNGSRYRYELTAIDQAGNRSRTSVSAVPTASPLLEPARGAHLRVAPRLLWKPVKRAAYYNVQLYRGKRKVLSSWPKTAALQLDRRWRFEGHSRRLAPGRYRWLVWPGFGKRAERRYGKQLGTSGFRVVR
ncbi:MAG TPA: hypothetical protein VI111_01825 [Thermoleophilaceae bacterium]